MGNLFTLLFTSTDTQRRRETARAIDALREARRGVADRIRAIDLARTLVVTKLRAARDVESKRYLLMGVRDADRRRRDLYALLTSTDASLARLDDATLLVETAEALRGGTRATRIVDVARVERIMDEASTRQEELADAYSALSTGVSVDAEIEALSDTELDASIARLLMPAVPGESPTMRGDDDGVAIELMCSS